MDRDVEMGEIPHDAAAERAATAETVKDSKKSKNARSELYTSELKHHAEAFLDTLVSQHDADSLLGDLLLRNVTQARTKLLKWALVSKVASRARTEPSLWTELCSLLMENYPDEQLQTDVDGYGTAARNFKDWTEGRLGSCDEAEYAAAKLLAAQNLGRLTPLGAYQGSVSRRLGMALLGGGALFVPMLVLTLTEDRVPKLANIGVATGFIVAVGSLLALFMRGAQSKDVLAVTAAYAAVLVVFVSGD